MTLSFKLKLLKDSIEDLKIRKYNLELASKCKSEIDKIYFIDHDWIGGGGGTSDAEDEIWREMMYSFLDKFDLDEDNYDFIFSEIESICFNKKRFWKDEDEVITKFRKIFPNLEEFKKKFKLFIFTSYFEEPEFLYNDEIALQQEYVNGIKEEIELEYPEDEIPNLDDL